MAQNARRMIVHERTASESLWAPGRLVMQGNLWHPNEVQFAVTSCFEEFSDREMLMIEW